jgi:hypothetical protein
VISFAPRPSSAEERSDAHAPARGRLAIEERRPGHGEARISTHSLPLATDEGGSVNEAGADRGGGKASGAGYVVHFDDVRQDRVQDPEHKQLYEEAGDEAPGQEIHKTRAPGKVTKPSIAPRAQGRGAVFRPGCPAVRRKA